MNHIEQIESPEFRKHIRENIIEYTTTNGIKSVDSEFIKKLLDFDALQKAEDFFKENKIDVSNSEVFSLSILNANVKRVIQEEVALLTFDTKFTNKRDDYIKVVDMLGFEKIFEKDYELSETGNFDKDYQAYCDKNHYRIDKVLESTDSGVKLNFTKFEKEFFYYDKHNGILLHFDTYGENINSSAFYFNTELRKNVSYNEHGLKLSGGFVPFTNKIEGYVDGREALSFNVQQLLKSTKPMKEWTEFNCYGYSYLSHRETGDDKAYDSWNQILVDKLKEFPKEVLQNLFVKATRISDYKDTILVDFVKEHLGNIDLFRVQDFAKILSDDVLTELNAKDYLFDVSSKNIKDMMSKDIYDLAEKNNINKELLECQAYSLVSEARNRHLPRANADVTVFEKIINTLNLEQLNTIKKSHEIDFKISGDDVVKGLIEKRTKLLESKPVKKTKLKLS